MAYESPITLMTEKIANDLANKTEGLIMECVQRVGVSVDKDELVRAMNYDRGQYEKGYRDGLNDAVRHGKWIKDDVGVHCSECFCGWDFLTGIPVDVYGFRYCPNCGSQMERSEG
jgi:predicted Zn-dependent protease